MMYLILILLVLFTFWLFIKKCFKPSYSVSSFSKFEIVALSIETQSVNRQRTYQKKDIPYL